MRSIDAMHLEHPWAAARTWRDWLVRDSYVVGRKHVAALMRRMGVVSWTWPQSWDWATRRVLACRLSNSMAMGFCIEAVEEAIEKFGNPEICNTDQGSQFTSEAFTGLLKAHKIKPSMDGKSGWRDNVFIERLWRSVKYEEVCSQRIHLAERVGLFNRMGPVEELVGIIWRKRRLRLAEKASHRRGLDNRSRPRYRRCCTFSSSCRQANRAGYRRHRRRQRRPMRN